jgi:hypothetical protein
MQVVLVFICAHPENYSHLITVPAGPYILSDRLLSSPIIVGEGGGGSFGAVGKQMTKEREREGSERGKGE